MQLSQFVSWHLLFVCFVQPSLFEAATTSPVSSDQLKQHPMYPIAKGKLAEYPSDYITQWKPMLRRWKAI